MFWKEWTWLYLTQFSGKALGMGFLFVFPFLFCLLSPFQVTYHWEYPTSSCSCHCGWETPLISSWSPCLCACCHLGGWWTRDSYSSRFSSWKPHAQPLTPQRLQEWLFLHCLYLEEGSSKVFHSKSLIPFMMGATLTHSLSPPAPSLRGREGRVSIKEPAGDTFRLWHLLQVLALPFHSLQYCITGHTVLYPAVLPWDCFLSLQTLSPRKMLTPPSLLIGAFIL